VIALACLAAFHALALAWIGRTRSVPASRRQLAAALSVTIPAAGPALAALALRTRGGGAPSVDELDDARPRRTLTPEAIHAAASRPAALERITATAGERRAVMATMARRGGAEAVALLRWTIERADGDAAIDAALTLEDLTRRHERRLADARARLEVEGSSAAALAAGDAAAALVESGLADPPMVPALADEAARHWQQAGARGADPCVVAERRARLALAAGRPDLALSALASVAPADPDTRERIALLAADAAFASRQSGALGAG
jgi:hypothetical protein